MKKQKILTILLCILIIVIIIIGYVYIRMNRYRKDGNMIYDRLKNEYVKGEKLSNMYILDDIKERQERQKKEDERILWYREKSNQSNDNKYHYIINYNEFKNEQAYELKICTVGEKQLKKFEKEFPNAIIRLSLNNIVYWGYLIFNYIKQKI